MSSSIYGKIAKVMSQVSRVPKNGYNSFHKYNYATESDLTESIRSILFEAGLAFFSSVLHQEREGEFTKVQMEFTIADTESGEMIKSTYWGEGQDKGDKGLYKAYTGATKYFLMKTFLIPTGDDPEADQSVDERNSKQPPQQQTPNNQNGGNKSNSNGGNVQPLNAKSQVINIKTQQGMDWNQLAETASYALNRKVFNCMKEIQNDEWQIVLDYMNRMAAANA